MMLPDTVLQSLFVKFNLQDEGHSFFKEQLSQVINDLIVHDFDRLVHILYQLDIPEQKLKQMLSTGENENAGTVISELIIQREIEKLKSREQFKREENIPEDEQW